MISFPMLNIGCPCRATKISNLRILALPAFVDDLIDHVGHRAGVQFGRMSTNPLMKRGGNLPDLLITLMSIVVALDMCRSSWNLAAR